MLAREQVNQNADQKNDEEVAILPRRQTEIQDPTHASKLTKYSLAGAQVTLCVIGAGAGALYLGPSETCADTPTCGKFLSDHITRTGAVTVFTLGGANYAIINAYFSAISLSVFLQYMKDQPTIGAKIVRGGFAVLLTSGQIVPTFLASYSTSTAAWQTMLTVSGAVPGAFYASVSVMENEVPYYLSKAKLICVKVRNTFVDLCIPISEAEWQHRARISHYIKEQDVFVRQLDARMKYINMHAGAINVVNEMDKKALRFLFEQDVELEPFSYINTTARVLGNMIGFGFATNFTIAFLANTLEFFNAYLPSLPLSIIVTLGLSFSNIYGNLKFMMQGFAGLLETLVDILKGKPINSLEFHLRPGATSIALFATVALSAFSYSVSNTLYEDDFPDDENIMREIGRYGANFGICAYHAIGVMETFNLFFRLLTRDQKEQFLFHIAGEVERIKRWPLEKFIAFIENNDTEEIAQYGLHTYENSHIVNAQNEESRDEEQALIADHQEVTEESEHVAATASINQPEPNKKSWFGSFCNFWRTNEDDEVEDEEDDVEKAQREEYVPRENRRSSQ